MWEVLPVVPVTKSDLKDQVSAKGAIKAQHTVHTFSPKHLGREGEFK